MNYPEMIARLSAMGALDAPFPEHEERIRRRLDCSMTSSFGEWLAPERQIIVLYHNRTGSNLVCEFLARHLWEEFAWVDSAGGSDFEIFNADSILATADLLGAASIHECIRQLVDARTNRNTFIAKMTPSVFLFYLKCGIFCHHLKNPKIVYVSRKNSLLQAVSHLFAIKTGQWNLVNPSARISACVDQEMIEAIPLVLRGISLDRAFAEYIIALLDLSPHRIVYEDMMRCPQLEFTGLLDYLNISPGGQDFSSWKDESMLIRQSTSLNEEACRKYRQWLAQSTTNCD
jgi:LPS sulfotransferase NodH